MSVLFTSMPPNIAAAVVAVASKVTSVSKDNSNEHGRYMFASVDQFYALVGPLMADANLFILADLVRSEVIRSDKAGQLNVEFNLYLVHASGEMFGPITREVTVVAAGPQAYASAESFVTKYFMRNLFKVPTGDKDDDADVQPKDILLDSKTMPKKAKGESKSEVSVANNDAVLHFVEIVNKFLDTEPSAASMFTYEGAPEVNDRFKKIRTDKYSATPAVSALLARINAIYASEAVETDTETGHDD